MTASPAVSAPPTPSAGPEPDAPGPAPATTTAARRWSTGTLVVLGTIVVWVICRFAFAGRLMLFLATSDSTPLQLKLNDLNSWIGSNRTTSPIFVYFFNEIRAAVDAFATVFTHLFAETDTGLGIPEIGWLGVVALLSWIAWAVGNWKVALLTAAGFVFIGLQGLFAPAMSTFALIVASVLISLVIGIPLGIWAGTSDRFNKVITPVLDVMQTLPTFVYLAPLALIFLIGPASAVITTVIYATPPVIRLTAHGLREVPVTTREAVDSLGASGRQRLVGVLLPMSKRTIVLGINQTTMAALSMVTIAALIAAPGLGPIILNALQGLKVGTAFNAGLAIVVVAIVLDRTTTAASMRAEIGARDGTAAGRRHRMILLAAGLVLTVVAVYLSRTQLWAAIFPSGIDIGPSIISGVDAATNWAQTTLSGLTGGIQKVFTLGLLNPFESLLTETPFVIVGLVVLVLAWVAGGIRTAVVTLVCLAGIVVLGLWHDAMITLASTLLATVVVMVLGIIFGVWMGRSAAADRVVRPVLDAAQTMPSFVYLVPFLGLFGANRFTAIVAAVVYASPVAIKIIADGIRSVSPTTVEAATSSGATPWQLITRVQLPMASRSLALAANQGLIYVLAMVVVGGLVGAGALGYNVVAGFVQLSLFGKGLAAGFTIVLLGIMLDRITQAAASRERGRV